MDSESKETVLDQIGTFIQRVLNDIWSSPINITLVVLIIFLLFKLFLLKRKPKFDSSSIKVTPPLPKMPKQDLTVEELRKYNGTDSNGRVLVAIFGEIFDVSRRSDLYGPGGAYSVFAGRDATRSLSKMDLKPSLFSDEYDELSDLTDAEKKTAREWCEDFRDKYDIVGRLLRPGEKPSVYPSEEATDDGSNNTETKKNE